MYDVVCVRHTAARCGFLSSKKYNWPIQALSFLCVTFNYFLLVSCASSHQILATPLYRDTGTAREPILGGPRAMSRKMFDASEKSANFETVYLKIVRIDFDGICLKCSKGSRSRVCVFQLSCKSAF